MPSTYSVPCLINVQEYSRRGNRKEGNKVQYFWLPPCKWVTIEYSGFYGVSKLPLDFLGSGMPSWFLQIVPIQHLARGISTQARGLAL